MLLPILYVLEDQASLERASVRVYLPWIVTSIPQTLHFHPLITLSYTKLVANSLVK